MIEFKQSELNVLVYANNFTLWHYRHEGDFDDLLNCGFFYKAYDKLASGDLIIVNANEESGSLWVTKSDNGQVEIKQG